MILFLLSLSIVALIAIILLATIIYFLEKRQEELSKIVQKIISETGEKMTQLDENQKTLRGNDDILSKDIETLLHELKAIQKKIRQIRIVQP